MWKTGHSLIKAKLKETGAPLAGEMSGHIFFKDRWYGFDDGLYAGARLLELALARAGRLRGCWRRCPIRSRRPSSTWRSSARARTTSSSPSCRRPRSSRARPSVNTIDGLRVEYPDGFGLMRASNTTPVIVLRFEADIEGGARAHPRGLQARAAGRAPELTIPA